MARKIGGNGGKPESKLGHRVAPAAGSVVSLMAEIFQIPENQLIEGVIRLGFDHLPVSQREAISVLLRAKGESIRDLRPLAKLTDQTETAAAAPAGETLPAGGSVSVRIDRIGEIARKSAAPVDMALDEIAG